MPTGGIKYKGNVLTIHSVKKEDRGTYYCVADNGIGKPARRNVAVEVEFPPSVTVNHKQTLRQAFGYSVEMVCHIEAFPAPTITWVHDGIQESEMNTENWLSLVGCSAVAWHAIFKRKK